MANTLASGASARKGLEVQLLSWAFQKRTGQSLDWPVRFFVSPHFSALPREAFSSRQTFEATVLFQTNSPLAFGGRLCYDSRYQEPFVPTMKRETPSRFREKDNPDAL